MTVPSSLTVSTVLTAVNSMAKTAWIAMSGGVDSSTAALLMQEKGYTCIGCMMKLYDAEQEDGGRTCCSQRDAEDARSVAYRLGMPFYVLNFKEEFRENVIDKFVDCYRNGKTPNPCIDCNRYLKFDALYERARILGCDCIVTGHYARIEKSGAYFRLKKAVDASKDQSYVLYSLTQEQLAHIVFPLGELTKTEVRHIAEEHGFCNSRKPDSQDICFVPDGDHGSFIERYTGKPCEKGSFTDTQGNILGEHRGIYRYTIGQRRGIGISAAEPYYVCGIRAEDSTVILGTKEECMCREMVVTDFNWISGTALVQAMHCSVRVRYHAPEQPAYIEPLGQNSVRIRFDAPQRAVTPGQAAVLYDGDYVLGGGTIETCSPI
ncbi:MAG: tRNA 2-thiouridine(34) synthase MnmA [Oscillospiraceae bacterium]|nr:tRNA 2-thiouridine(34) synthase MnmA [Oscillospiraceae bacterium]